MSILINSKIKLTLIALVCTLSVGSISSARATTAIKSGSDLLGFDGLQVDSTIYNVRFIDGKYKNIFGATNMPVFTTQSSAIRATKALDLALNSELADFSPKLMNGCTDLFLCFIHTAYELRGSSALVSTLRNQNSGSVDLFNVGAVGINADLSRIGRSVFADWEVSQKENVPIPSAFILFMSGVLGLFMKKRIIQKK